MAKAFEQIDIKKEGNPHEGGYYYTNLGKIWYKGAGIWDAPPSESKGHYGFTSNPEWFFREGSAKPAPPKSILISCLVCKCEEHTRIGKNIPDWWYSVKCLDGRVQGDYVEIALCSYECMTELIDKIPEAKKSIDPFSQLPLTNAALLILRKTHPSI